MVKGQAYNWLDHLSNNIGGRLSGSLNAQRAVEYTKAELEELGLDKVWLQPVMVPKWTRGAREHAYIQTGPGMTTEVNITALGGRVLILALLQFFRSCGQKALHQWTKSIGRQI